MPLKLLIGIERKRLKNDYTHSLYISVTVDNLNIMTITKFYFYHDHFWHIPTTMTHDISQQVNKHSQQASKPVWKLQPYLINEQENMQLNSCSVIIII